MRNKILVTGGSGFIGSHLVDLLLEQGEKIKVIDNLSIHKNLISNKRLNNNNLEFLQGNIAEEEWLFDQMYDIKEVWHLGGNSDIKAGAENMSLDIDNNIKGTISVLNCMRLHDIQSLIFASSSTVYGELDKIQYYENDGPLLPISLFGASKLTSEGLISAYSSMFNIKAIIFRLGNVVGSRMHRGIIHDLIHKLLKNPKELYVLGDGLQARNFIHVNDVTNGMYEITSHCKQKKTKIEIFNLASDDLCQIKEIPELIKNKMGLENVKTIYSEEPGWKGDLKRINLSIKKATNTGWKPENNSLEAIDKTIDHLIKEI